MKNKSMLIVFFIILIVMINIYAIARYGNTPAEDVPFWVWLLMGRVVK